MGWFPNSQDGQPAAVEFPFPVNRTAMNLTVHALVANVYPVVGSLPRETANFSVTVRDASDIAVAARGRDASQAQSEFTIDLPKPTSFGTWTVGLSGFGGSDGQSAGDRYRVDVFVNYP